VGEDARALVARFGSYASPPGSGNLYARALLARILPLPEPARFRTGADTWPILLAPFFGRVVSLPAPGGCYRIHAAAAPGALAVIGNADADPARGLANVERTVAPALDFLRRAGLLAAGPTLPPPWLLRIWLLARLAGRPRPARLYGRAVGAATILRSVAGWTPYAPRKRVAYAAYLLLLWAMPPALARRYVARARRRADAGAPTRSP
jgi:hypothetical protein